MPVYAEYVIYTNFGCQRMNPEVKPALEASLKRPENFNLVFCALTTDPQIFPPFLPLGSDGRSQTLLANNLSDVPVPHSAVFFIC